MAEISEKATNGRMANGRFGKGNRGGPGNPFNRRIAELRRMLMEAVSERLPAIVAALIVKAEAGDVAAIRIALQYGVGMPLPAADPDRVDVEEWKLAEESMVTREAVEAVAIETVPVAFATAIADVEAKVARLEAMFPTPAEVVQQSNEVNVAVEELEAELEDERENYLEDATFRRRWNANYERAERRSEIEAARLKSNGGNGDEPASSVERSLRESPSPNGGNGRPANAAPKPNGGNGGEPGAADETRR